MIKILKIGTRSLVRIYAQDVRICFLKDTCVNLGLNHHDRIRIGVGDGGEVYLCKHPDGFAVTGNGQHYCFAKCHNLLYLTGLKVEYMNEYELIRRPELDEDMEGECYELKLYKSYKQQKGVKK